MKIIWDDFIVEMLSKADAVRVNGGPLLGSFSYDFDKATFRLEERDQLYKTVVNATDEVELVDDTFYLKDEDGEIVKLKLYNIKPVPLFVNDNDKVGFHDQSKM